LPDGVDPGGVSSAPTTDTPPESHRCRWTAAGLLTAVGGFQVALAAGLPWGRASWGGAHAGVLPTNLRVASGASALVYAGLAVAVAGPASRPRSRVLAGAAALTGASTLTNLASRSSLERAIWTPTAAVLTGLLWNESRRAA